ncbi:hypothetical protein MSAN_01501200 [Mycena sanguinolenta]|uniref:Uncharacterized protein n=1 Tax=Mycena sanguinolenta TaxID=230812 RepID=A0A8H6Y7A0_9AGAR|nr:hypothetical protein MSAN_01501200 [Mycena sanguinolenta]
MIGAPPHPAWLLLSTLLPTRTTPLSPANPKPNESAFSAMVKYLWECAHVGRLFKLFQAGALFEDPPTPPALLSLQRRLRFAGGIGGVRRGVDAGVVNGDTSPNTNALYLKEAYSILGGLGYGDVEWSSPPLSSACAPMFISPFASYKSAKIMLDPCATTKFKPAEPDRIGQEYTALRMNASGEYFRGGFRSWWAGFGVGFGRLGEESVSRPGAGRPQAPPPVHAAVVPASANNANAHPNRVGKFPMQGIAAFSIPTASANPYALLLNPYCVSGAPARANGSCGGAKGNRIRIENTRPRRAIGTSSPMRCVNRQQKHERQRAAFHERSEALKMRRAFRYPLRGAFEVPASASTATGTTTS